METSNRKVSIVSHNYLEELASGVNQIVEQLKVSIDEERQTRTSKKRTYYKCIA